MARNFRFSTGIDRRAVKSLKALQHNARHAESLGYDVVQIPDHLGAPAPFPVLAAVAAATTTVRLGTFVLNACFYKPALLARDVQALAELSDNRFELGMGAGYVREEFDAAELPFPSASKRIEYLQHVTTHIAAQLPDIPVLIAGNGDKLLTVAARHADIVGLTGGGGPGIEALAERVEFVRAAAGDRFSELELNLTVTAAPPVGSETPDLTLTRRFAPDLSDEELMRMPSVLSGSTAAIAETLTRYRDELGITYFTVMPNHTDGFAPVVDALR